MDDLFNSNPYAPPVNINDAPNAAPRLARSLWHRVLLWIKSVTIIAAIGVAYIEIESIIFSGGFYVLVSILIGVFGLVRQDYLSVVLSAAGIAFALSIFLLIQIKSWSPGDADGPVQSMMLAYGTVALPATLLLSLSRYQGIR